MENGLIEDNTNDNNIDNNRTEVRTRAEIQREHNQEMQNLLRRVNEFRNQTHNLLNESSNINNSNINSEEIFDVLINEKLIYFLPLIILIFSSLLYFTINKNIEYMTNLKYLEHPDMWPVYFIAFPLISFITYFFHYLIFFVLFEKIKINNYDYSAGDILYLNPAYINIVLYFIDKEYFITIFDTFVLISISTYCFINYMFFCYLFNYFKIKISLITNLLSQNNLKLILKMRAINSYFIFQNLSLLLLFHYILLSEADFTLYFIIQFKLVYLIIKQTEYWINNEISYKQLDNIYSTNETLYIRLFTRKILVNFISLVSLNNKILIYRFLCYIFCYTGMLYFGQIQPLTSFSYVLLCF